MSEERIGLACSGGGIRSAAFSSGALRRLLHRRVKIDYVSCVSGGNYVAASYLDWKYRHNQEDGHKWHKEFFEYMRRRVGYICNWERPLQGIVETIILVLLLITVNLVIPCVMYSVGAFAAAYVIDYVFGRVMRKGFTCIDVPINSTGSAINNSATERRCTPEFAISDPEVREQFFLFVLLFITFIVFYSIKVVAPIRLFSIARFFQVLSGVLFIFTFMPWLIQQFIEVLPSWLNTMVIVLSLFFWLGFPPLRRKASLALVFYFYAFVVKWRVYQTTVIGIAYDEHLFYKLLLISGGFIWLSPYFGMFSMTAIFTYYKWRLQRAFFTKKSVGSLGCKGIGCRDFFPILSCCRHKHDPSKNPLVMADLKEVTPQYISNVAVDYWRKKQSLKEPSYSVMALSPTENERVDHQPGEPGVEDTLLPSNVNQADAMVTSAAVMAISPEQDEPFRDLQILLGLTLRKGIRSNPHDSVECIRIRIINKILPIVIQSVAAFPVIFLAVISLSHWNMKHAEGFAVAVFVAYAVIFFAIAIMPTGGVPPWFFDKFARWCHVHLYHVRLLREVFQVDNVGPVPPALLSLSDAGRLEKFGLLPLLKKRLKRILILDGSFIKNDEDYSKHILRSLDQARRELHCEFVGSKGRDVIEEMRKKYVDVPRGHQPRHYRFKVRYYDKNPTGGYLEVGKGKIMIIAPRHPDNGEKPPPDMETTWAQYTRDTGEKLDTNEWGPGPVLRTEDVDRLTLCCCESCHSNSRILRWISNKLCLGFPSTSTANQFFTPSLFTAYHREGYRACVQSGVEEFLTGKVTIDLGNIV